MSLLMEALRKAEEAKSKAAKDDKEHQAPESPAPDYAEEDPVLADTDEPGEPDHEAGPVVINPDPDEEETLAAHAAGGDSHVAADSAAADLGELTLEDLAFGAHDDAEEEESGDSGFDTDIEQIEFTTAATADAPQAPPESPAADTTAANPEEEDDDSLSLLKSGYFSRTKPGVDRPSVDDLDLDADDQPGMTAAPEPQPAPAPVSREAVQAEPANPASDAPADSTVTATPQDAGKAREREIRESAGAMFKAKQHNRPRRSRKVIAIAAAILVIPVGGAVYWFYTEMTSTPAMGFNIASGGNQVQNRFLGEGLQPAATESGQVDRQATATGETTAETAPTSAPAGDTSVAAATETTPAAAQPGTATDTQPPAAAPEPEPPAAGVAATGDAAAPPTPPATQQQPPQQAAPQPPAVTAAPANDATGGAETGGLNFVRTTVEPQVNPDLDAAYDNYQRGDLANSSRLYQQVLAAEPTNRDAMLGLASVYVKQNNVAMAQNLYARLLELNPRDPLARAGLLDTVQDDPVRREAELKTLINAYPGSAPLSYALGNLYAAQNRWNDAQSAYFDALLAAKSANAGPISPDYAFNLAVSLERINQLQPALEYYREAANYAQRAAPGFDMSLLQRRMDFLEQQ